MVTCLAALGVTAVAWPMGLAGARAFPQTGPTDTLRAALERSRATGDSAALAESLNAIGLRFWTSARFDSAEVYLTQARDVWSARHDSAGLGRVYNNLGVTFYQWGHFAQALDALLRSVEIRRARGDASGEARSLTNVGRVFRDWGVWDRARSALDQAVRVADASGDPFVRGYARYNLGLLFLKSGDAAAALSAFEASLDIYAAPGASLTPGQIRDGVASNRIGLARVRLLQGDPAAAIAGLEQVLGEAGEGATSARQAETLLALGEAYQAVGASQRAVRTFERALEFSRDSGQRTWVLDALRALSAVHERTGEVGAALQYARTYEALGDSVSADRAAQEADGVESRLAAEHEARQNVVLREQGQVREAVIARQQMAFWLGGPLFLVSVALVAVLVATNRRLRERQRLLSAANQALEDTNRELRRASSEIRRLEGLIPICARCKKVRDESGYWESVESYVASRSDALFSHGICGECGKELYGDDWSPEPGDQGR